MAGSKSNYLESAHLNYWLGKSFTAAAPSTVFVALYNTAINDAADATSNNEVTKSGTNYARKAVANSSANWTNSSGGGSKTNKTTITFTTSVTGTWGTVVAFAILDTSSTATGNILYWGDLAANQTISVGNTVRFSTGAIVLTED